MKVLFLPDYSQTNAYQRELAEGLRRCGASVDLTNGKGPFPLIGAVLSHGDPDVLHLHWTEPFTASKLAQWISVVKSLRLVLELLALKVRGTTTIRTVHNLAHHERLNPRIELITNRICARLYDHMIVHSQFGKDSVVQTYSLPHARETRVTIIPHGNYIAAYENSIDRAQARVRCGLKDQDVVFLFLGHIRPYKDVSSLVSAFRRLLDPQARLLIAGKPMDVAIGKELEDDTLGDERIRTRLAFIPDDEIQVYMNAADAVVLASEAVLSSGTAILAASFGKAVVAPDVGCITEVLDQRGVLLYHPGQEDGLLNALRSAVHEDLAAMGHHNLERARQLDWDGIAQKTYQIYQRCLA